MDEILGILERPTKAARYEGLPEEVLHAAKRCLYGSWNGEAPRIARQVALGSPSTVGTTSRTAPERATFANGTMIRYLDFNDNYNWRCGGGHPSDHVAAVLAAGDFASARGTEIVAGIVAAYDVFAKVLGIFGVGQSVPDHSTPRI